MTKQLLMLVCTLSAACSTTSLPPARTNAPANASAPSCAGGVAQNDAELARYAGCSAIDGDLLVRDVTSLESLGALEHMAGRLRIEHTERLYSLAGLERLRSVRELELRHNDGLISGGALRGLAHAERIELSDNPRLTRSYGFMQGIERSGARLDLSRNTGLTAEGVEEFRSRESATTLAAR
ncbi:MAG TPA: hypothetical protein VMI54_07275 [Polyangiaceae bacterium]|nr:hypothetical protein [Polyangiaceae bacterium]